MIYVSQEMCIEISAIDKQYRLSLYLLMGDTDHISRQGCRFYHSLFPSLQVFFTETLSFVTCSPGALENPVGMCSGPRRLLGRSGRGGSHV